MSLKKRIEAMKLPGHNGPAIDRDRTRKGAASQPVNNLKGGRVLARAVAKSRGDLSKCNVENLRHILDSYVEMRK